MHLWQVQKQLGLHAWYFSQAGQDRYLNEQIFKNRRNGTFVEIGGHDGWTGSNCGSRTSWAVADGTRLACSDGQACARQPSRRIM